MSSQVTPAANGLSDRRLEALAQALAAALPCTDRVSLTLLELLTAGQPVAPHDLAVALGTEAPHGAAPRLTTAEAGLMVGAAMQRMPNLELDEQGRIVGCGLTLSPTDHQIVFSGPRLYTWCAFDTVLFPTLLGRRAEIRSHCKATNGPIRCSIGPDGPEDLAPTRAVISLVMPEPVAACCDVRGSFCRHVHFFASATAAGAWRATHEAADVVSVAEACAIARRIAALGAVRGMERAAYC